MSVTIKDVARRANVSVATVSRALNGHQNVADEVRKRVLSVADQMRYSPHHAARSLSSRRTQTIGVVLPDLYGEFFSELVRGIDQVAREQGLHLLVSSYHGHPQEQGAALRAMRGRVDGLLLMSPFVDDMDSLAGDLPSSMPAVLMNTALADSDRPSIGVDNHGGAKAMMRHLLDTGHRRIAVIGTHPGEKVGSAALREQGFRAAMAEAGVPVEEALLRPTQVWHRNTGAEATDALIDSGESFDAVFALNDAMALGVLHSLSSHRIDVPGDVAVIGFDDIEDAAYTRPTLSTIAPGRDEIASRAVTLLQERIAEANTPPEGRTPIQRVFARYELVVRQSAPAVA